MNGILPRADGLPLATLAAILNTRPVDYAFRRRAVPLANAHFQANKQFVAPLPIPADLPDELHTHSERLCAAWQAIHDERGAHLAHLASVTVADPYTLAGSRALTTYDEHSTTEILAILDRVRAKLAIDTRARSVRDQLTADLEASSARIAALRRTTETLEAAVEPSSPTRTASAPPSARRSRPSTPERTPRGAGWSLVVVWGAPGSTHRPGRHRAALGGVSMSYDVHEAPRTDWRRSAGCIVDG